MKAKAQLPIGGEHVTNGQSHTLTALCGVVKRQKANLNL
jgi:hypothetical protein